MTHFRNEKGFTLIELMVVILIIGILVAIAIPVFNNARASAQTNACKASMRTVEGAIETWRADNPGSAYPTTWGGVTGALVSGYIKKTPVCPAAGTYSVASGGDSVPPVISCSVHGTL